MSIHPPAEIYMTDMWSGSTCITLQILYMYGFEQPPFVLSEIDRRIGRASGLPIQGQGELLELLRHGFTLTEVDDTDIEAVLGPNGYEYMVSYLAHKNPEVLPEYTPIDFTEWREELLNYHQHAALLRGRLEVIPKEPEAQDILQFFSGGCGAVIVPFRTRVANETYLTIAYGADGSSVAFYVPQLRGSRESLFQTMTLEEVDARLAAYDGIVGVSL